jgi:hypothetical protein
MHMRARLHLIDQRCRRAMPTAVSKCAKLDACAVQVLCELPPIRERAWCHAAISIRVLFPPAAKAGAAASAPHLQPPFFDALAALLARGRASLAHVLHCLSVAFADLANTWTAATFDGAMKAAAKREPKRTLPAAADFRIDLTACDVELTKALGAPPPVQLLLVVLRAAPWPLCATLIGYFGDKKVTNVAAHRDVALALLARVESGTEEAHRRLHPDGALGRCVLDSAQPPPAEPLPEDVVSALEVRALPYTVCQRCVRCRS